MANLLRWVKWLASLVGIGKTDWTGESFKANFRLMRKQEERLQKVEDRLDKCEDRHRDRDRKDFERDKEMARLTKIVENCGQEHEQTSQRLENLETKIA